MTSLDLFDIIETTWPAAKIQTHGPWMIRDGAGGGQRVSAATTNGCWTHADIDAAETKMAALGQAPLFMIRPGDEALDDALQALGYNAKDRTLAYTVPAEQVAGDPLPHATAMPVWPPLEIQKELWAEGGINAARLAVMDRVESAKTAILGRTKDQPAGVAFVAMHGQCAMIHAIEVTPHLRRHGVARLMLRRAAHWTLAQGGTELCLLVTEANAGANALYASLGFENMGHYHYRVKAGHP